MEIMTKEKVEQITLRLLAWVSIIQRNSDMNNSIMTKCQLLRNIDANEYEVLK